MTGFSQANWSQSLNFDLLLPKRPLHNTLTASEENLSDSHNDSNDDNNGLSVFI